MSPSSLLRLPICCCAKDVPPKTSKNQSEKPAFTIALNGKHMLTVPGTAVNGRVVTATHPWIPPSPEHVAIDMPEEFTTARTSRDHCNNHLSMNELMRLVRTEEGLKVTPRQYVQHEKPSRSSPRAVPNSRKTSSALSIANDQKLSKVISPPQTLDAKQLLRRERARRAVFDSDGDITSRSSPPRSAHNRKRSTCSMTTISGENQLVLRHPPAASATRYITVLPHMFIAVVTISLSWLANLLNMIAR
ncbi:hypothetical protein GCK32_016982 [Trichostrongylus colubriformis]|uniref:Uncharacterized protein n=1 Tax=Trichostrongylus colubriformis TaxID=6319 RepID=A0AAN8F884_TRICO